MGNLVFYAAFIGVTYLAVTTMQGTSPKNGEEDRSRAIPPKVTEYVGSWAVEMPEQVRLAEGEATVTYDAPIVISAQGEETLTYTAPGLAPISFKLTGFEVTRKNGQVLAYERWWRNGSENFRGMVTGMSLETPETFVMIFSKTETTGTMRSNPLLFDERTSVNREAVRHYKKCA